MKDGGLFIVLLLLLALVGGGIWAWKAGKIPGLTADDKPKGTGLWNNIPHPNVPVPGH